MGAMRRCLSFCNKKGEGETNALRFDFEISTDDVQVARSGNDMVFTVADNGSIIVKNWYSSDAAKLDRAEFPGGVFLDARDLEKLVAGKQLAARTLFIDSPEIDPEMILNNAINEESEEREAASSSEGGSSGCNTGCTVSVLVCMLGALVIKKRH